MTRINVIHPSELENAHLLGELHEILRPVGLVRKAQERKVNKYNFHNKYKQPKEYTLGTGHVVFFYDKLGYVVDRYALLCEEARNRGFRVNEISKESVLGGIDKWWRGDYTPTPEAIQINKERIEERLTQMRNK